MSRAVVLGAGSWGTALSLVLARNGAAVSLWGRDREQVEAIQRERENVGYLPGQALPPLVEAVHAVPREADMWVLAVPSGAVREVCGLLPPLAITAVIATKGLEHGSGMRMSEVVAQVRPEAAACVLSGPNLATELAKGIPTATVIASGRDSEAERVRELLMCTNLRVYTSDDVVGVELGGALKNVMALAAGMSDGLGYGDNTKGALLARGLNEMATLGKAFGARLETFMGLSGVGDLFATAASSLSRNYRVGKALGAGRSLESALDEIGQVAEGVPTSDAAVSLARQQNVQAPLMSAVHDVVEGRIKPEEAVGKLMGRLPREEFQRAQPSRPSG